MDWQKDTDGAYFLYVDPDAIITHGFGFTFGQDANCNDIDLSGFTFEISGDINVKNSFQVADVVNMQISGTGEIRIALILSNGDIRYRIRRFKQSTKSENFQ